LMVEVGAKLPKRIDKVKLKNPVLISIRELYDTVIPSPFVTTGTNRF